METFKNFIQKFTPYLEDMRRRLYFLCVSFIVVFITGFLGTGKIIKFILSLFDIKDVVIATTSPFQFADLSVNIGLAVASLICCPLLVYHIFSFLSPALSKKEKKSFVVVLPLSVTLFSAGFVYGFFILYYALITLARINNSIGVQNIWDVGTFLSQIIITATLLGVLFQFPIVVSYLIRMGLMDVTLLRSKRKIAVFIIFIFATLLPPTDGLSLIAMVLPLTLLYELTILANSRVRRSE